MSCDLLEIIMTEKTPSIIKCFQTTSSPPILLVTAIANNFCSHTRRADFLKGFLPEKRVLLVTGLLQSTSCLWHSFTCCTSRVPREVTWTDIHLLMQEEGWKSANKLRESAQCLWFFPAKGVLQTAAARAEAGHTLLPFTAVMDGAAGLIYDHPCHTDTCPCPWAMKGCKNKGDKWQSTAAAEIITFQKCKNKPFFPYLFQT